MENKKTALIVEGGGQRGVFSFGITDTFINRNYDPFDIYMGVSNGVAVLCWYLIRETDNNLEKMLYAAKGDYLSYKNIFIGKILKVNKDGIELESLNENISISFSNIKKSFLEAEI